MSKNDKIGLMALVAIMVGMSSAIIHPGLPTLIIPVISALVYAYASEKAYQDGYARGWKAGDNHGYKEAMKAKE